MGQSTRQALLRRPSGRSFLAQRSLSEGDGYDSQVRVFVQRVAESAGRVLFSRLDLVKLIDPVLRPSYITAAAP